MRTDERTLEVALVKEACPLCGALIDGPIVMNTRLTPGEAKKVKALHGQTIGYAPKPCPECQDVMSKAILLIGVVEAKSPDMNNPYRSGNKWGVTEDFIRRTFSPPELVEDVIKKRACFFPVEEAEKMGFPNCNIDA